MREASSSQRAGASSGGSASRRSRHVRAPWRHGRVGAADRRCPGARSERQPPGCGAAIGGEGPPDGSTRRTVGADLPATICGELLATASSRKLQATTVTGGIAGKLEIWLLLRGPQPAGSGEANRAEQPPNDGTRRTVGDGLGGRGGGESPGGTLARPAHSGGNRVGGVGNRSEEEVGQRPGVCERDRSAIRYRSCRGDPTAQTTFYGIDKLATVLNIEFPLISPHMRFC